MNSSAEGGLLAWMLIIITMWTQSGARHRKWTSFGNMEANFSEIALDITSIVSARVTTRFPCSCYMFIYLFILIEGL